MQYVVLKYELCGPRGEDTEITGPILITNNKMKLCNYLNSILNLKYGSQRTIKHLKEFTAFMVGKNLNIYRF